MKYLLDTHTFIWALENNHRLSKDIVSIITDERNDIYISAVSLWELGIKNKKYPDVFTYEVNRLIDYATMAGYIFLSLSSDSIRTFSQFDYGTHKDPFDQMLIAQSISNGMRLITHDEAINKIIPQNVIFF